MAPWWWFLREPKHVGAAFICLMCFNNPTIYIIECISWTIKYLILLMHGATMKIVTSKYLSRFITFRTARWKRKRWPCTCCEATKASISMAPLIRNLGTLHTRRSSTQNNKHKVSQKHSCFSWWWGRSSPKRVVIDKYTKNKYSKNKLFTKLALFTRLDGELRAGRSGGRIPVEEILSAPSKNALVPTQGQIKWTRLLVSQGKAAGAWP